MNAFLLLPACPLALSRNGKEAERRIEDRSVFWGCIVDSMSASTNSSAFSKCSIIESKQREVPPYLSVFSINRRLWSAIGGVAYPLDKSLANNYMMQVGREEKKKTEAEEYQARLARAIERAAAPTFKRTGKPIMMRSTLRQKMKQNQEADAAKYAEAELQKYIDRPFPC